MEKGPEMKKSLETQKKILQECSTEEERGSNAFVPSVAGMIIAAEVVKDLTQFHVMDLFKD